jgi:hypothetical protein
VIHQTGAGRGGQVLGAKTDEAAGRNPIIQTHAAFAVGDDRLQFALAVRKPGHDRALVGVFAIDGQLFPRLELHALFFVENDFRPRHGQLKTFAAHVLDKHGEMQFAAA